MEEDVPLISFRSLFKRFARYSREDCLSPTKTNKESDFDSLIRTLYLLGLDCTLATSKKNNKLDLDQIGQALKNWKRDEVLKEMFRAGAQPKLRSEWLGREIPRLEQDLSNYQIAEDYRALEVEAGNITKQIRILEKDKAIADFQLDSIEKTLLEHPDISREDLMELYAGLQEIFRPETLAHFDAVAQFHSSLSINRQKRLQNDKIRLIERKKKLDQEIGYQVELRDKKLQALQGKRALDEYAAIANQLAEFKQELERLNEFLNFSKKLQERAQEIREVRVEEDRAAANYAAANPIKGLDEKFKDLAEIMYPRVPAGMVISPNTGDNQLRFDFSVQIEGDDSDGINAAKIICFDWLVLNYGAHHNMDMLWHDNRLFADIDPGVRGRWFSFVHAELLKSGKQYIATLNTENYEAMKGAMSDDIKAEIEKSIVLTLRGDQPSNKLLGIQFGKALGR